MAESNEDLIAAQKYYEDELDLRESIVAEAKNNISFLWELAVTLHNLGIFYYNKLHDRERAIQAFLQVLELESEQDSSKLEEVKNSAREILRRYF